MSMIRSVRAIANTPSLNASSRACGFASTMLSGQGSADSLDYFVAARNYAERGERSTVDHHFAVDQYLVLGIVSMNHVHVDLQLTPELRRRTDGVESGYSIRAVANFDSCHFTEFHAPCGDRKTRRVL